MTIDPTQPDHAVAHIKDALKQRGQLSCMADPVDVESIKTIRSLGRRAGRELGWKVRTFVTDPSRREDGMSLIWVVVTESNPLHEQLMAKRGEKAIRRWMQADPLAKDS